jgi:hypothetical protein
VKPASETAGSAGFEALAEQMLNGEPKPKTNQPGGETPPGGTTEPLEEAKPGAEGQPPSPQPSPPGEGEPAAEPGAEPGGEEPAAEPGAEPAEEPAAALATKNLEKRITKLLGALEKQQAQIEELRNGGGEAAPMAVEQVLDVPKLAKLQNESQQALDLAEDMLSELGTDPEGVAETLRKMGADFKDANGREEWTPARMSRELRASRRGLQEKLRLIPQQMEKAKGVTQARASYQKLLTRPEIVKAAPFLADEESDGHALYQQMRSIPFMRAMGGGDYWAAAAVVGHRMLGPLIEAAQKNGSGAAAPGAKLVPGTKPAARAGGLPQLGKPGARPAPQANLAKLKAAKEKYAQSGRDEDLADVLESVGM